MYLIPTPLVSIIPLRKKDEKQLEELGYKFSHNETNHIVYKHTVIKHPQKGAIYRVSRGSSKQAKHFKQFYDQVKATVKLSMDAMA
tara:strand:- start:299 stop:556 length:258 start_codon:yes stop_codon:yes gene_type:complete